MTTDTISAAAPLPLPPAEPTAIELHLSSSTEFSEKGWSRKVKATGGTFNDVRGYAKGRIVTVPNTPEGRALATALLRAFPVGDYFPKDDPRRAQKKTCVILRGVPQHGRDLFYIRGDELQIVTVDDLINRWRDGYAKWWQNEGQQAERARMQARAEQEAEIRRNAPQALEDTLRRALDSYCVATGASKEDGLKDMVMVIGRLHYLQTAEKSS